MDTIVVTILGKLGEYLVAPVGRQLGYLYKFNENLETLKEELDKIVNMRCAVQLEAEASRRNLETLHGNVKTWLDHVISVEGEAQSVIDGYAQFPKGCVSHWCLGLKTRYKLSRYSKKKSQDIVKLQIEGKFKKISFPAVSIPVMTSTSTTKTFETRKWILDEIIAKMMDDNLNMIGICGMGGVGKTTMAEQVLKRVMDEKLFDECVMTVISQKKDLAKVQNDIAEMLGLGLHEQNSITREAKLHQRLENRRVLIFLDDVWEEFELKVLGINFQGSQVGCKVLFTSREQGLWRKLKTKLDFPLDVLTEYEAWDLFEEIVYDTLKDKPELQSIAKEIVMECAGLPLALVTLGGALLGKSTHSWKDAMLQLKTDYPTKIPGIYAKVHQSLELSYTFLENEDAKSLFLLCCLFEEDFKIPVEDLVRIGCGLRLFRGITGLEQTRNRVFSLLEQLKSRYLLLMGEFDRRSVYYTNMYVKMHDVVRDVAKYIAREEKRALVVDSVAELSVWQGLDMFKKFLWISIISNEFTEFPTKLISSGVMLLRCNTTVMQTINYNGMKELRVFVKAPISFS